MLKKFTNKKGFTLMEMLIVVAIIAVLVAIAIPVLSNSLHKAGVAADWANVRALYADLQADYLMTGECVAEYELADPGKPRTTLNFYDNGRLTNSIELKYGVFYIVFSQKDGGYQIAYFCNRVDDECTLYLGYDG